LPLTWYGCARAQGIEHERIHLETSSVLIRQMHLKDVQTLPLWQPCPVRSDAFPKNELVLVPGGKVLDPNDRTHAQNPCAACNIFFRDGRLVHRSKPAFLVLALS
jgi:hypothetical protein